MALPFAARRLLLGLGVTATVFGALEGALRLRYPREDVLLYSYERPGAMLKVKDGILVPQPHTDVKNADGPYAWTAHHDALGLRETTDTPEHPPAGKRRLLALGDSWIYGFSVTQGRTIADRLEARVPDLDVVNAGVFGSSAYDMLRRYTDLVDVLHPEGIVLGLPHNATRQSVMADERANFYAHPASPPRSHLRTYLYLRWLLGNLRTPMYATPPTDQEPVVADILTLARDARRRGLSVYFLLLPVHFGGGPPDGGWVSALEPEGVKFAGHRMSERACWGFVDLGHPSEAGADAIAATLAAVLQGGPSQTAAVETPSCIQSDGAAPGKDGWPEG